MTRPPCCTRGRTRYGRRRAQVTVAVHLGSLPVLHLPLCLRCAQALVDRLQAPDSRLRTARVTVRPLPDVGQA